MPTINDAIIGGQSVAVGIIAHAGGTQALATPLTAAINSIATCATAADSVALPQACSGAEVIVENLGAASCQVFGQAATGDTINGVATATGVAVANAKRAIFFCTQGSGTLNGANVPGKWGMILSA